MYIRGQKLDAVTGCSLTVALHHRDKASNPLKLCRNQSDAGLKHS